ncbi:MAG: hypothetical protein B6I24_07325 [Bacteroidetes bacterium 4572_128]|nr:MAG: hypothetical protein B6I24_07325 [Bacteroidetes bacterium 4572_128]
MTLLEDKIKSILKEKISGTDIFLVDIQVKNNDNIFIFLDSEKGLNINQCAAISKFIEINLDREKKDFSLEVSSAGLDLPLKILKQYKKYLNWDLEIITLNGEKIEANLSKVYEDGIKISYKIKEKIKNKKVFSNKEKELKFNEIKTTKVIPKFK